MRDAAERSSSLLADAQTDSLQSEGLDEMPVELSTSARKKYQRAEADGRRETSEEARRTHEELEAELRVKKKELAATRLAEHIRERIAREEKLQIQKERATAAMTRKIHSKIAQYTKQYSQASLHLRRVSDFQNSKSFLIQLVLAVQSTRCAPTG